MIAADSGPTAFGRAGSTSVDGFVTPCSIPGVTAGQTHFRSPRRRRVSRPARLCGFTEPMPSLSGVAKFEPTTSSSRTLNRPGTSKSPDSPGDSVAAELEVSPATLYNWRRTYGGMDADAATEIKELREQNARLKRLLAEAELETDAMREVAKGKNLSPAAKRHAVDMLKDT